MIIILEGIDNSGKSTLAQAIQDRIGWRIQPSEGPPKYAGEMNDRLARYEFMDQTIFDRHPVVSQNIYKLLRTGIDPEGMRQSFVDRLYARHPLFIYCDPGSRGMTGHTFHEGVDSEEHLRQVDEQYHKLLEHYRAWAIVHAQYIYRIGDGLDAYADLVAHQVGGKS